MRIDICENAKTGSEPTDYLPACFTILFTDFLNLKNLKIVQIAT